MPIQPRARISAALSAAISAAAIAGLAIHIPVADAQQNGTPSSVPATTIPRSSTTVVSANSTTSVPSGATTTTTTIFGDPVPTTADNGIAELGPDGLPIDFALLEKLFESSPEGLSRGSYSTQPLFDPASNLPIPALAVAAQTTLTAAVGRLDTANVAEMALADEAAELERRLDLVGAGRAIQVAGAAESKLDLRDRLVNAYVRGDQSVNLFSSMGKPTDFSRATRYLEVVADNDLDALERFQAGVVDMDDAELKLVELQASLKSRQRKAADAVEAATVDATEAQFCVYALSAGSRDCPLEFQFPVLGDVNFINSWGFIRLPGAANQHWHEGTDIMAPFGREVVAVESGTVYKVGTAGLGGLRLWLKGDSGNHYYFAHFQSINSEVVDGLRVTPGTPLGHVGDTGGASGGPPHLHFEIHPNDGEPVNPYHLLRAAWGDRPMPLQSTAIAGPSSALLTVPPEER